MILINSAGYVVPELQVEYGRVPACMIPLGNQLLLQHQLRIIEESAISNQRITLSLPYTYELRESDRLLFESKNIFIVRVPDEFTLGESILYVLNSTGTVDDELYMLHGDTYLERFPGKLDVVGVSKTTDNYNWQLEEYDENSELIWCGFFSFSRVKKFIRALALSHGNFVDAIKSYSLEANTWLYRIEDWFDLGHLNTYFKSREKITTQRSFNDLNIGNGKVVKSGLPVQKIRAEGQWFQNLPADLKKYIPQLMAINDDGHDEVSYSLEYLTLPPLNEVYVYGLNPPFYWKKIFSLVSDLFSDFRHHITDFQSFKEPITNDFESLIREKTYKRLSQFAKTNIFDPSREVSYNGFFLGTLESIASECIERTLKLPCFPAWVHGDLCFSNMLFDSRSDSLKVIDPRGINDQGQITVYGDQRYDLAKLSHSVVGMYDYIIAGRYRLNGFDAMDMSIDFDASERMQKIHSLFLSTNFIPGLPTRDIQPLVVLLFLSMLPLHADRPDRQKAMIANALRLYAEIKETRR
ncbi:hypothetical protein ACT3UJ_14390 [Halomonas sp. 86]|uniref:hypothetical protein n=1 Tax=unclassified Halomonas TaxID=2609666 RepID=UPI004033A83A